LIALAPMHPLSTSSPSTRPPRTAANRHLTINTHPSCDPLCMGVVAEPARSARTRAHMQACTQMHQPIHTLERQPCGPWPATSRIHIASLCKPHLMRALVYEWPASYTNGQPRVRMVSRDKQRGIQWHLWSGRRELRFERMHVDSLAHLTTPCE
jgi:hypothetical protein